MNQLFQKQWKQCTVKIQPWIFLNENYNLVWLYIELEKYVKADSKNTIRKRIEQKKRKEKKIY